MTVQHLVVFVPVMVAAWLVFTYVWPRMLLSVFKRAILVKGFGDGPVPINTLYTQSEASFADPLRGPASGSRLASTGVNRDTLLTIGWLDLSQGPQVLHVPDMDGRYYSVQFTNPSTNTTFAYVGKRTTGTAAGEHVISGPRWAGHVPDGLPRIASPTDSVLVIGRVLVYGEKDVQAAHSLSVQIRVAAYQGT